MRRHIFCILVTIVFALALGGCAQNIVHLAYPPQREQAEISPKKSRICVVDPENKRGSDTGGAIGVRLNGTALLPRTPVERWLASGIAEELARAGYAVTMAETVADAIPLAVDFIVAGEAEEVWLAETSLTRFTGSVRASIALLDGTGQHITTNSYNSVYSKTVLPVYGVPQTLLDEALAEMLHPAVRLLAQMMP